MQLHRRRFRAPYRNEVVFRSAQRLIASRPGRRGPRPPRWAAFVIGVGVGAVLVFLLVPRVRETLRTEGEYARGPAIGARTFGPATRVTSVRRNPPDTPAPAARAESAAPAVTPPPPAAAPVSAAPVAPPRSTPRAVSGARAVPPPAPAPATLLTRATTRLKLVGELRGQFDGLLHLELELYLAPVRNGGSVDGLVRLSAGEGQVEVQRIAGGWVEHTMTLREVQEIRRGFPQPSIARSFVLEFPTTADRDEITGVWTRGAFHGRVTLKSVPLPEPVAGVNPNR